MCVCWQPAARPKPVHREGWVAGSAEVAKRNFSQPSYQCPNRAFPPRGGRTWYNHGPWGRCGGGTPARGATEEAALAAEPPRGRGSVASAAAAVEEGGTTPPPPSYPHKPPIEPYSYFYTHFPFRSYWITVPVWSSFFFEADCHLIVKVIC